MRILVTGASGFIGGALAERLVVAGHEVITLGRTPGGGDRAAAAATAASAAGRQAVAPRHLVADLTDPRSLEAHREVLATLEQVAHLGGFIPRSAAGATAAELAGSDNTQGTAHLLALLPPSLASLCFASSVDVYAYREAPPSPAPPADAGEPVEPVGEDEPPRPATPYGASKAAAEETLRTWAEATRVPLAILRLTHIYGPGDTSSKAVPAFLAACRRGVAPVVRGGADVRDYLYIDDAVEAFVAALASRAAGTFNIASGRGTTVHDLAHAVLAATAIAATNATVAGDAAAVSAGRPALAAPDLQPATRPPTGLVLDIARARAALDWQPRVGLTEGLRRTAAVSSAALAPSSTGSG